MKTTLLTFIVLICLTSCLKEHSPTTIVNRNEQLGPSKEAGDTINVMWLETMNIIEKDSFSNYIYWINLKMKNDITYSFTSMSNTGGYTIKLVQPNQYLVYDGPIDRNNVVKDSDNGFAIFGVDSTMWGKLALDISHNPLFSDATFYFSSKTKIITTFSGLTMDTASIARRLNYYIMQLPNRNYNTLW